MRVVVASHEIERQHTHLMQLHDIVANDTDIHGEENLECFMVTVPLDTERPCSLEYGHELVSVGLCH